MPRPSAVTRRSISRSSATAPLPRRLGAATVHKAPWEAGASPQAGRGRLGALQRDEDFSESTDLAASNPEKLKELQALFMKEAERYRVLPIDDRASNGSIRPWRAAPT